MPAGTESRVVEVFGSPGPKLLELFVLAGYEVVFPKVPLPQRSERRFSSGTLGALTSFVFDSSDPLLALLF